MVGETVACPAYHVNPRLAIASHGEWLDWLAFNCPEIGKSTAYNYMGLYEKAEAVNLQLLGNLTPMQAYKHYQHVYPVFLVSLLAFPSMMFL